MPGLYRGGFDNHAVNDPTFEAKSEFKCCQIPHLVDIGQRGGGVVGHYFDICIIALADVLLLIYHIFQVRPYQFDVLFHEYSDSIFCHFDL